MFTVELSDAGNWLELTADVLSVSVARGFSDPDDLVATPADVTVVLSNSDGRYSPDSWQYRNPAVGQALRIRRNTTVVFTGTIERIQPAAGRFGERTVTLYCSDLLSFLRRTRPRLARAERITTNEAAARIVASAFGMPYATGSITITGAPAVNDWVEIGGRRYTFVINPSAAYEVARGASANEAATALAAAINDDQQDATLYGSSTRRHPLVAATVEPGAPASGSVTLSKTASDSVWAEWKSPGMQLEPSGVVYARQSAQRFTAPENGAVESISLYVGYSVELLKAGDSVTHKLKLRICAETESGLPGDVLGEKTLTRQFTYPQTGIWEGWETWTLDSPVQVYEGLNYWVILEPLKLTTAGFSLYGWYGVRWNGTTSDSDPWGVALKSTGQPWAAVSGTPGLMMQVTINKATSAAVRLSAVERGAHGNQIALSKASAALTLSGAAMSGGQDYSGLQADSGMSTLDVFAPLSEDADALSWLAGVVESEQGRLYCDADNVLRFRNRDWLFSRQNATATVTIDNSFADMELVDAGDRLINRAIVRYTPPRTLTSGVLARANMPLEVPGGAQNLTGQVRWNGAQPRVNAQGVRTFAIPFNEKTTASEVYTPVPGTDYTVTDSRDGSGYNYTSGKRLRMSVAVNTNNVEVTCTNTALGSLYVHNLQIRGTGQIFDEEQQVAREVPDSIALYGVYEYDAEIPYSTLNAQVLAEALANYILYRSAYPRVSVLSVTVDAIEDGAFTDIEIGDVVNIKDGIVGETTAVVLGIQIDYSAGDATLPVKLLLYDTRGQHIFEIDSAYDEVDGAAVLSM